MYSNFFWMNTAGAATNQTKSNSFKVQIRVGEFSNQTGSKLKQGFELKIRVRIWFGAIRISLIWFVNSSNWDSTCWKLLYFIKNLSILGKWAICIMYMLWFWSRSSYQWMCLSKYLRSSCQKEKKNININKNWNQSTI